MLMTEELTTEKSGEKPAHKARLHLDAPIREVPERHRERILRHLLAEPSLATADLAARAGVTTATCWRRLSVAGWACLRRP